MMPEGGKPMEPDQGTWNVVGGDYFHRAVEDLGLDDDEDLKREEAAVTTQYGGNNVPRGEFPTFDRVMERAWELREED